MTPSRFTKIKVSLGYILLLGVLLIALLLIRKEIRSLSNSGNIQELMTDSLLQILGEKDKSVLQLIQLMNRGNDEVLTIDEIEKIVAVQDSVFTQPRVQKNIVTKHDTVISPPRKKKFFRRVADVFSPSKKDTVVVVNTIDEISIDTLLVTVNPADSLYQNLLRVNDENKLKRKATANRNSAYFKKLNAQLTARIDSIMLSYEDNIANQAIVMAEREQQVRERSTEILSTIAIVSIVITLIFVLMIWRDLSRSNRYRKQLEAANHRAEELLVAREKLMLAITHDIKAPLSSIIGYLELLRQSVDDDIELGYVQNMESSSTHLLKLVTDLLDFHRLDLNKMEVNRESFNPVELFTELRNSFLPLSNSKSLDFEFTINPILNGLYISDPMRIRQIVTNILSNAIKFTEKGAITFDVDYQSQLLVVIIKDTGVGMQPEQTRLIFQEFTRLPEAQGKEGFGLGLSIVNKLVALLEGEIAVESTPSEGTQFTISVPLYAVAGAHNGNIDKVINNVDATPSNLRVIMIDDDRMQLKLTAELLAKHGIKSVQCTDLNDLLDALRREHFDALLTDVQMPAISGFQLLHLLRASNINQAKDIPVIAVTARNDISTSQFIEKGFAGCLYKPFSVNELISVLSTIQVTSSVHLESNQEKKPVEPISHFEYLTSFIDGDKEEAKELVSTFIDETTKDINAIQEALISGDVAAISAKAHKILPIFTMMKYDELVDCLTWLELVGDQAITLEIENRTQKVIKQLHFCVKDAANYLTSL